MRETSEETGLTVIAIRSLGQRVHPITERGIAYIACEVVSGEASVIAVDEIESIAWVAHSDLPHYVPYGVWQPVQHYLDEALRHEPR